MARKGRGAPPGKGKVLVPPPGKGKGKAVVPPTGKGKGKALVPPMKGAAAPPPRPMRGRVVTVPVLPIGPPPGRGMGPPPPGRGAPPRMMPPDTGAERLEPPPVMQRPGAPAAMAALRRGKVAF
jgi:hypothetical protein